MFRILIASPKGGSGKSTLAMNLAGMLAARKQRVLITDLDKQHTATLWESARTEILPRIFSRTEETDAAALRAFAPRWQVIDTAARLRRADRTQLLSRANVMLVPIRPSVYDIEATAKFLNRVLQNPNVQSGKVAVALVGIRVDGRTRIGKELASFFEKINVPVIGFIADSPLYPQCALDGTSIFDLPGSRTAQHTDAWQPVIAWLKTQLARARSQQERSAN